MIATGEKTGDAQVLAQPQPTELTVQEGSCSLFKVSCLAIGYSWVRCSRPVSCPGEPDSLDRTKTRQRIHGKPRIKNVKWLDSLVSDSAHILSFEKLFCRSDKQ